MPTVSIDLSTSTLRRALDLMEHGGYSSLDAFVETLIESTPIGAPREVATLVAGAPKVAGLLDPVVGIGSLRLAVSPTHRGGRLPFLTNRLNPVKVFCRALANLATNRAEWPEVHELAQEGGLAARELGQRLRTEDVAAGRKGFGRRWVGYPVSEQAEAAIARFSFAFGVGRSASGTLAGPLVTLGLAAPAPDGIALTQVGWELACLPSPILGEGDDLERSLSQAEAVLFGRQIAAAPEEDELVGEFLKAVDAGGGQQVAIDKLLSKARPDWSIDRAASERAALVGRLQELGMLRVVGRGRAAEIEILNPSLTTSEGEE